MSYCPQCAEDVEDVEMRETMAGVDVCERCINKVLKDLKRKVSK